MLNQYICDQLQMSNTDTILLFTYGMLHWMALVLPQPQKVIIATTLESVTGSKREGEWNDMTALPHLMYPIQFF
jgi:hypothetical protein